MLCVILTVEFSHAVCAKVQTAAIKPSIRLHTAAPSVGINLAVLSIPNHFVRWEMHPKLLGERHERRHD